MSGFTFIHAADLHVDSPLLGLERYEGAPVEAIRGASRQALQNLVRLATHEKAAFVVLAGDIFDGDWRDYNTGVFFHRQLALLERASVPVFITQGNHDAQSLMTRTLRLPANTQVFPAKAPASYRVPGHEREVVLHGQSFLTREVHANLAAGYPAPEPGLLNLGVLHTSVDGREGHAPYAPCKLSDLEAKGYDYWALGHVHKREVLAERPWVVFPGNLQGRHARETGPKGCSVVTVREGAIAEVRHEALDVVRWVSLECDVAGLQTAEEVVDRLAEHVAVAVHAAEGRLLAARVRARGRTRASSMRAEPHRWRAEVLARVASLAGDAAWVEKVVLDVEPPSLASDASASWENGTSENLAVLERILAEVADAGLETAPDFALDLEKKLGAAAARSDDDEAPTSPGALARARGEAVEPESTPARPAAGGTLVRIDRLELIRWGALEGVALDFARPGTPGLHVVYGDNEAGKSTTRRAIGALLFGVPAQTPDGFRFDYKNLRLGATLRLSDGSTFSFERRKGVKDTVRDAADRPLDESPLARLLAGIDRESFEREWSLDHERLREGGRELLSGKGVVGESLLAAGLGGVGIKALQDQLQDEAAKLAPSRHGTLRQLLDAVKAQRLERDAHAVHPKRVEELEARLDETRRERQTQGEGLAALGRELARLERIERARPILAEHDRLAGELARLAHVPVVAADFGKRRVTAQQAFDQAELDLTKVGEDLARRDEALARTVVPEGLLERQAQVGSVVKGLEAFVARLEQGRDSERDLEAWTNDLGRISRGVGLSRDELEGLALGSFRTLAERTGVLAEEGSRVRARRDAAEANLAAADESVHELSRAAREATAPPVDDAALRRAHEKVTRELEGAERELKRLRTRARESAQRATDELERLAPRWTRGAEALARAPLPRAEDVDAPAERQRAAGEELALATTNLADAQRQRDRVTKALERLVAAGEVPTEAALGEARARRASGWRLVRPFALGLAPDAEAAREFLDAGNAADRGANSADLVADSAAQGADGANDVAVDGAGLADGAGSPRAKSSRSRARPKGSGPELARAFERAVERVDDVSDRLRRESARTAKLAQLEEEADAARAELASAEARLARAQAERASADAEWVALFQPVCLEADSPRVMRRFLEAAQAARELLQAAHEARTELDEREAEIAALLAPLAALLHPTEAHPTEAHPTEARPSDAVTARDLGTLRDEAQERIRAHDAARKAHDEARKELARASGAVEKHRRELDEALALEKSWSAARAELARDLNLAPAVSLKEIQVVVAAVGEAADLMRQIVATGRALSTLNAQSEAYQGQVAALLAELGEPNPGRPDVPGTVGALARRLQAARTAHSQRAAELARKDELEARRDAALERRQSARLALARLCAEAGTEDPRALVRVETEDEARRRLQALLEKAEAELAVLATDGLANLRDEALSVPADEVSTRRSQAAQQQEAARARLAAKSEEVGASEHELAKVAGGGQAAEDELAVQSLLARIREAAAEYLRLSFATRLLRDAAERYRSENQSPMLRRTSELLARLTLGSFSGVAVDEDAREIRGQRGEGELVGVEGMSEGVRDQLFLALRLAALEQHLARREALPFVVDDILIQLSDDRARATLEVLAELGQRTQVLLFTHHSRVSELARALGTEVTVHRVAAAARTNAL